MHPIQNKLLKLISNNNLEGHSLREIGSEIGVDHSQQILHHLNQLENKGYIRKDENGGYLALKRPIEDVIYLPLYGKAKCGNESLLNDGNITEQIPLPSKLFNISTPKQYFLVRAEGDSMKPLINEDDLVLVSKTDGFAQNNDIYVLTYNGDTKIKRVTKAGNIYILMSLNPDYSPIEVHGKEDELQLYGIVKSIINTRP